LSLENEEVEIVEASVGSEMFDIICLDVSRIAETSEICFTISKIRDLVAERISVEMVAEYIGSESGRNIFVLYSSVDR
jgi:hypothetical protein